MLPLGTPITCPVMIGRDPALGSLHRFLERSRAGDGPALLVSGEAGIGKSRLVREAIAYASANDYLVLQGQCFQYERTWPYAPLLELLRAYLQTPGADLSASALVGEVVRLLPELQPRSPGLEPAPALEPEQEKRRLFSAIAALLLHQAAQQPLLLIVEDLHWSDDASLDFLLYLARRATSTSLLLLLTYRDDEGHPGLPWLAELDRNRLAYEIRLSRLSRADVHAMLRAIFALQRPVRREFLDTIYALTDGNPFFVEEILSTLVASGDITSTDDGAWDRRPLHDFDIPRSVQAAVQQRVDRLGEDARHLLAIAAVAGRSFDATLLQEIARLAEAALLSALKELVDARLVVESTPDRFAFRHALTRQAIYGNLLARERKVLHRLCAEALAQAPETDTILGDLAYHFNAAEVWTEALHYGWRAAQRALTHYAPRAAVEHLDHALHAAEQLSVPPTSLLRMRAHALDMLGDFAAARADLERVLGEARAGEDRRAEWEALVDLGQLWASRDYAQAGSYWQDALTLARTLDPAMHAHSLNRVGNWYLNREQPDTARRNHSEALAIFEGIDDKQGIAETLDLLGMTNYLGGDLVAGTAHYERAAALCRALDDRVGLINCLATLPMRGGTYQTNTMAVAASLLTSHVEGEEALAMARAIGWRAGETYALIFLGFCLGSRGDYARALDVLPRALALAQEIAHRQWITAARCALGALYLDLLAPLQARAELERAVALAREIGSTHWLNCTAGFLASVYLQQQEPHLAEELLTSILGPDAPAQTLGQRLVWCARADLALANGDSQEALAIVDRLEMAAANRPAQGRAPALRLLLLRADALAATGRLAEAEAVLQDAYELALSQGARPMLWRVHTARGNLFRRQERFGDTETACEAARAVVESLAAAIPEQTTRDTFLRGAFSRLPPTRTHSARRVTRRPVAPLTARECEIAAEVARGKTNAAIAATLVLSERTVESHIGNIRSKLGCTSRSAIAAWATEAGLAPGQDE